MKNLNKIIIALMLSAVCLAAQAQNNVDTVRHFEKKSAELACGECMFKMPGKGCDLAVKIDGKFYFVDGRKIDDFGDAHADDGFCNAVRKATVTGEIVENRFKAKSIQLVETKKKEKPL